MITILEDSGVRLTFRYFVISIQLKQHHKDGRHLVTYLIFQFPYHDFQPSQIKKEMSKFYNSFLFYLFFFIVAVIYSYMFGLT